MKKSFSTCFLWSLFAFCCATTAAAQNIPIGSMSDRQASAAPAEVCAEVDANLNLKIHCAELVGYLIEFNLNYFINAADPSNLYWKLDIESVAIANCDCQSQCATVDAVTLNISFPCISVNGTQYDSPITLQYFPAPLAPAGLYWRLVLPPPIATMTLLPMASDCPGTGTVSSSGDKSPGNPVVGAAGGPPGTRGYIEFEGYPNTFSQDQSLKVDRAYLRIFVTDPNAADCDVRVVSLQDIINPEGASLHHLCGLTIGGASIWNEISRGPLLGGTTGSIQSGWFELPLDPAAVEAMLRRTNQNYIGIGLMEAGDDGDALVFDGWDSNPLNLPQLVIDYYKEGSSSRPDDGDPTTK